jgi:transcriptional regulator with XRE-family HTH domain
MTNSDTDQQRPDGVRLGEIIRDGRTAVGLSQRQLGEQVGVHHSFVGRLEAGDYQSTSPQILQRLSRILELDERDLFALAGLDAPEGLPTFTPYLRAKYEMSDEAAKALHEYFNFVSEKFDITEKQPPAA